MTSKYLEQPLRTFEEAQRETRMRHAQRRASNICECGRGVIRTETEMCAHCEADGQANVIDLDAADFGKWGG